MFAICMSLAGVAIAVNAQEADAQAWAGGRDVLDLTTGYTFQYASKTFEGDVILTGVPTTAHRWSLGAQYVVLEKLTVSASIYSGFNQYSGPQTGAPGIILAHGENDDGNFHFDITDFVGEARYMALDLPLAVSPFLRTTIPTNDYPVNGYAAAGKGLKEVGIGAYVGKVGVGLDEIFLHGSYSFTLVEKHDGGGAVTEAYSTHRSDLQAQAGYLLGTKVQLFAMFDGRLTHGGWDLIDFPTAPQELRDNHDPIVRAIYTSLGAGAGYAVRDDMTVGLNVSKVLWGDNVSDALAASLNLSWSNDFGEKPDYSFDPDLQEEGEFEEDEYDDDDDQESEAEVAARTESNASGATNSFTSP